MFTLVVMAAGIGSRYGGTKQLASVGPRGEAFLDFAMADAAAAGATGAVLVVRSDIEDDVRRHVEARRADQPPEIAYVCQDRCGPPRPKPWGTAHAVLAAAQAVAGPFAVCNADDYYGPASFSALARKIGGLTPDRAALCGFRLDRTLPAEGAVSRGICTVSEGRLLALVEHHGVARAPRSAPAPAAADPLAVADPPGPAGTDDRVVTRASALPSSPTGALAAADSPGPAGAPAPELVEITAADPPVTLPGDAIASMNLWAFPPAAFDWLEEGFARFLAARGRDETVEYLLPAAVAENIESGSLTVDVVTTDETWIGVTNPDDLPTARAVVAAVRRP